MEIHTGLPVAVLALKGLPVQQHVAAAVHGRAMGILAPIQGHGKRDVPGHIRRDAHGDDLVGVGGKDLAGESNVTHRIRDRGQCCIQAERSGIIPDLWRVRKGDVEMSQRQIGAIIELFADNALAQVLSPGIVVRKERTSDFRE